MIGMVLVTHGRLADRAALRNGARGWVTTERRHGLYRTGRRHGKQTRRDRGLHRRCDTGDGVVLLTDMFGGTPCNLAISMMEKKGVEVIAGVNLPMLVKLAKVRSKQPLADAGHLRGGCRAEVHRRGIARAAWVQGKRGRRGLREREVRRWAC